MSLPSQFPAKVCASRCSTCVFGPNSPIDSARMRELADSWRNGSGHQICHHHGIGDSGEDVWGDRRKFTLTPQVSGIVLRTVSFNFRVNSRHAAAISRSLSPDMQVIFVAKGWIVFVPPDAERPPD